MQLIYTNDNGESLILRQRRPYFLERVDGSANLRQAIHTFRAPDQDGAFFISGSLEMRNITLEGTVIADTPDMAAAMRRNLLKLFTPKARGALEYRRARIPCIVEEIVFRVNNIARAEKFFISLLCPTAYFEALDRLRAELAVWMELFQFVLEIPEDTGVEFGTRTTSQLVTLSNPGDAPCGCVISFLVRGTVSFPEIQHLGTGETFRFNRTMLSGEELRVYTHFAGKRAVRIYAGNESNALPYMDVDSSFIQLLPGDNTLWSSAADNYDLLEVNIFYRPLYLGV